jgi:hypothetical protein
MKRKQMFLREQKKGVREIKREGEATSQTEVHLFCVVKEIMKKRLRLSVPFLQLLGQ